MVIRPPCQEASPPSHCDDRSAFHRSLVIVCKIARQSNGGRARTDLDWGQKVPDRGRYVMQGRPKPDLDDWPARRSAASLKRMLVTSAASELSFVRREIYVDVVAIGVAQVELYKPDRIQHEPLVWNWPLCSEFLQMPRSLSRSVRSVRASTSLRSQPQGRPFAPQDGSRPYRPHKATRPKWKIWTRAGAHA